MDGTFEAVYEELVKYKAAKGGFVSLQKPTYANRRALSAKVNTLTHDLAALPGKPGPA